jgi:hypothetical protein
MKDLKIFVKRKNGIMKNVKSFKIYGKKNIEKIGLKIKMQYNDFMRIGRLTQKKCLNELDHEKNVLQNFVVHDLKFLNMTKVLKASKSHLLFIIMM